MKSLVMILDFGLRNWCHGTEFVFEREWRWIYENKNNASQIITFDSVGLPFSAILDRYDCSFNGETATAHMYKLAESQISVHFMLSMIVDSYLCSMAYMFIYVAVNLIDTIRLSSTYTQFIENSEEQAIILQKLSFVLEATEIN